MSEISSNTTPQQAAVPMNSAPLIVDAPPPAAGRTKLVACLAVFLAALVFMATLILPSFALKTTDHAWGDATGPGQARIELGWRRAVAKGLQPVEFQSQGGVLLVWRRAEGEHVFGASTPGWAGVFRAGTAVGVMVILALSSPLFLFVCVPFAWKKALRGDASWTDACGATVCVLGQAIWLGFGAAILGTTLLFASRAERAMRGVGGKGVTVVCQGEEVCGPITSPEECGVCTFDGGAQGVVCQGYNSSGCTLELVDKEDEFGGLEFDPSTSVWLLVAEGVMLIGAGIGMCGVFLIVVWSRLGKKETKVPESAV